MNQKVWKKDTKAVFKWGGNIRTKQSNKKWEKNLIYFCRLMPTMACVKKIVKFGKNRKLGEKSFSYI